MQTKKEYTMKLITVFTPTFNRKELLQRAYQSLLKQDVSLFLWLIVDDGSTDGTKEMVEKWKNDNRIQILYFYQENCGKQRAHNLGVEKCSTELFVCLDSDDCLSDNCISKICKYWKQIDEEVKTKIAGLLGYKHIIGRENIYSFPEQKYSSLSGLYMKGFVGDTTLVFRTEVIRKYPFPVVDGEKFISESIAYNKIDQDYQYALLPINLMDCEYQSNGYTAQSIATKVRYPKGWYLCEKQNYEIYGSSFKNKSIILLRLLTVGILSNYSFVELLKKSPNTMLSLIIYPLAAINVLRYKIITQKL